MIFTTIKWIYILLLWQVLYLLIQAMITHNIKFLMQLQRDRSQQRDVDVKHMLLLDLFN